MPPSTNSQFENNVFINCPFDTEYFSLLRPLLFTIAYLGFVPRIALESSDSGETRIEKICDLIKSSKYSVHDGHNELSRESLTLPRHTTFQEIKYPARMSVLCV